MEMLMETFNVTYSEGLVGDTIESVLPAYLSGVQTKVDYTARALCEAKGLDFSELEIRDLKVSRLLNGFQIEAVAICEAETKKAEVSKSVVRVPPSLRIRLRREKSTI
jgi:hypothetical protein